MPFILAYGTKKLLESVEISQTAFSLSIWKVISSALQSKNSWKWRRTGIEPVLRGKRTVLLKTKTRITLTGEKVKK